LKRNAKKREQKTLAVQQIADARTSTGASMEDGATAAAADEDDDACAADEDDEDDDACAAVDGDATEFPGIDNG
jgi:hypothetical protein